MAKKLQKNRYIKRIIKIIYPFINPIIYTIEDIIYSFTNIPDDDSSVGSNTSGRKKVHFEDEDENNDFDNMDFDHVEDIIFDDEKNNHKSETKNKEVQYDILDEIRNDMNIKILPQKETFIHNQDQDQDQDQQNNIEEIEADATLSKNEVHEIYKELVSVKSQLNNIED